MADEYARALPSRQLKQTLVALRITHSVRYWVVLVWGFALGFAADWRAGAAWSATAAVASLVRADLERRAAQGRFQRLERVLTTISVANSLLWVIAPLIAWRTGRIGSQMIAEAMLMAAVLMVFTQFGHRMRLAALVAAPYIALGFVFALSLRSTGAFWPFMTCILVLGCALAASVLYWRVHRALIERYQARQAALIGQLKEARDHANAANAAKSAFLAMISHELRTPMNGVLGAAQLLDGAELASNHRRYVEMIRNSGDSLLALLNDMLDFAKIESGKIELEIVEMDLPALVERVCAIWSAKAEAKGLTFRIEIAPGAPRLIEADPNRLSQILHNLLSNAVKFTDEGEVSLTLKAELVTAGRARLTVAVSDSGIGIAPEDQARLFQPFSQLDSSSTRRHGGTGLGLAISRRLAELFDGRLEVESGPDRGSVFTLTLEAAIVGRAYAPASATPPADAPQRRPLSVLVAEDHAVNRQLVSLWLEAEAHRFACAENGLIALELAGAQAFDVILMDVNMPEMDGLNAVRRLREEVGPNRATPVIMLSASARPEDLAAGLAAGANAYLSKPIDFSALRAALARFAERPDEQAAVA